MRSRSLALLAFVILFTFSCTNSTQSVITSGRASTPTPVATPTPIPTPTPEPIPTPIPTPTPRPTPITAEAIYEPEVEQWRIPVVEALQQYGLEEEEKTFMRVLWCESRGDPNAKNPESGASGLMQHIPSYWDDRATAAGFHGASPFDPIANIYASVWLLDVGGWSHWECY
ncbi:MAG: hypothetical protein CL470_02045 [Acidimicrobiaceae bacterium]|nr:hypothetical protein [Acidimicrobiaceae bacterium]